MHRFFTTHPARASGIACRVAGAVSGRVNAWQESPSIAPAAFVGACCGGSCNATASSEPAPAAERRAIPAFGIASAGSAAAAIGRVRIGRPARIRTRSTARSISGDRPSGKQGLTPRASAAPVGRKARTRAVRRGSIAHGTLGIGGSWGWLGRHSTGKSTRSNLGDVVRLRGSRTPTA